MMTHEEVMAMDDAAQVDMWMEKDPSANREELEAMSHEDRTAAIMKMMEESAPAAEGDVPTAEADAEMDEAA
jgi:hypothetical protein